MVNSPRPLHLWILGTSPILEETLDQARASIGHPLQLVSEPLPDDGRTLVLAFVDSERSEQEIEALVRCHAEQVRELFLVAPTRALPPQSWIELGLTGQADRFEPTTFLAWLHAAAHRISASADAPNDLANKVVEALPDSYMVVDRDGIFVEQLGHRLPSESDTSIVGHPMSELLPPELLEPCVAIGKRAWKSQSLQTERLSYKRGTESSWLDVSAVPLSSNLLLVGVRDATRPAQDHQSLAIHRRLLELLHRMTESGHFEWDLDTDAVWLSPALTRLLKLGTDAQELSLQTVLDEIIVRQPSVDLDHLISQMRATQTGMFVQLHVRRADGEDRIGWCIIQAAPDNSGQPTRRMIGAFHDVTDQANLHSQLLKREEELDEVARISALGLLASQVAHQLNQPLFSITNYAEACRLQLESWGEHQQLASVLDWLEKIVVQARSTGESLRRMTRWLQRRPANLTENNLVDTLNETMSLLSESLRQHQISLSIDCPEPSCIACYDRVLMRQLISNLVQNSIHAMQTKEVGQRQLDVAIRKASGQTELVVRDQGVGFDVARFPKLCQPFVTDQSDNLGIGLSIAKAISETFGGRIYAVDVPVGSEIHVVIPAAFVK